MGNWKSSSALTSDSPSFSNSESQENSYELQKIEQAMAEALQNPLILHKIIKCLDFLDLRTSRLVSKIWNSVSSEVLRKRDCALVIVKFDLVRQKYRQGSQRELHSRPLSTTNMKVTQTLESLNETLTSAPPHLFPSTHFVFFGGDLSEEGPLSFFKIQGPHIKTLELIKVFHEPSPLKAPQTLREILQLYAPNIQALTLKDFNYELDNSHKFQLPALRHLDWSNLPPMTSINLLKWAPQLETTKNAFFDLDLHSVQMADKVSTVKGLHCELCKVPSDITSFANMDPRLQSLEFSSDDLPLDVERKRELSAAYSRLLEVNKDSLLSLNLHELCYRYEISSLPVFGTLTQLKIGSGHRRPCFPPGIHLTETFPCLERLDCSDLRCQRDSFWGQYFPPPNPFRGDFPFVRRIEVFDNCNAFFMRKLEELCPNFRELVLHGNDDLAIALRKVFTMWQHLTALELRVHPFSSLGQFPNLDSAITGLDEVTCETLREMRNLEEDPGDVEIGEMRVAPSICDLRDLEIFRIVFEAHSHYELGKAEDNQVSPLSDVSGRFGFKKMDRLKVSIQFDHNFPGAEGIKSTFESIGPYVNFHHFHNFRND